MDLTDKNIEDSFEKFGALYAWSTSIFIFQLLALTWFTGRIRVRTQKISKKLPDQGEKNIRPLRKPNRQWRRGAEEMRTSKKRGKIIPRAYWVSVARACSKY
ncbi:Protein of unknown function [Cotesia congregata]|uniref:Uncharacterized protein n=1 Tax=Cotesia congregata TaxID=51543 RepID=A0A8J2MJ00_COTCN|nr:Protein of unknown function [Cotesia congregata]